MRKSLLFLLASFLCIFSVCAEEPPELERLRNSYERAKQEALDPLNQKYVSALEDLQKRFMRANDLDGANSVAREIKLLKEASDDSVSADRNPKMEKQVEELIGTWTRKDHPKTYIIESDGTARHGTDKGSWHIKGKVLNVRWENGFEMDIPLGQEGEEKEMTGYSPGRKTSNKYWIRKVPD